MSLFLVQPRHFKHLDGPAPSYPASVEAKLTLGPEDAFGVAGSSSRHTIRTGTSPQVIIHANEGTSTLVGDLIEPISLVAEFSDIQFNVRGNQITIVFIAKSQGDFESTVISAGQFLPAALSLRFGEFVWLKEFTATVDRTHYRLEVSRGVIRYKGATSESQANLISETLTSWLSGHQGWSRWLSAVCYYRNALRLSAMEPDRHALVAEVLLNLTKAIEILLTSDRDRLRKTALEWGFTSDYVEQQLIPLLLIRNQIDVAHPKMSPLSPKDRETLEHFVITSTSNVGKFLERVLALLQGGNITLPGFSESMGKEDKKLFSVLAKYLRVAATESEQPSE